MASRQAQEADIEAWGEKVARSIHDEGLRFVPASRRPVSLTDPARLVPAYTRIGQAGQTGRMEAPYER